MVRQPEEAPPAAPMELEEDTHTLRPDDTPIKHMIIPYMCVCISFEEFELNFT